MATTVKDASQGKEKIRSSPSAPQNTDSPRARRTPKSLTADSSSDKNLAVLKGKSTPHYLKHTVSSAKDVCKYGKKQASDDTNLRYTSSRRKSTEPSPPPPSSVLKRTLSASSRGRTTLKPSSSLTKNVVSTNKPVLDKTSKTQRSGKPQPVLTRPASIKKGTTTSSTITASKKETKARTSHANKTPSKPDITEKQVIQSEPNEEEKVISVQDIGDDHTKIEPGEGIQDEAQPTRDQIEPESKSTEDEKSNACDSSILSEEQELVSNPPIEEQEEKGSEEVPENDNQLQEDDEQGNVNEEAINDNENCVNIHIEEGKPESKSEVEANDEDEKTIEKTRTQTEKMGSKDDGSDGNSPQKLNFRKGKELEKKEEDGGSQRLKFKERAEEDMEGNGDAKPEQENVVLKRQDVQGKKESPAYNDVIEETASKLVEKRKSKVKALVGAFETVISLENDNQQTEDT